MENCKKCDEYPDLCECSSGELLNVVVSAGVGYLTDSAILGGLVGGSFLGGVVGDILGDDEGFSLDDFL